VFFFFFQSISRDLDLAQDLSLLHLVLSKTVFTSWSTLGLDLSVAALAHLGTFLERQ